MEITFNDSFNNQLDMMGLTSLGYSLCVSSAALSIASKLRGSCLTPFARNILMEDIDLIFMKLDAMEYDINILKQALNKT